jgi:hypothetical protein
VAIFKLIMPPESVIDPLKSIIEKLPFSKPIIVVAKQMKEEEIY